MNWESARRQCGALGNALLAVAGDVAGPVTVGGLGGAVSVVVRHVPKHDDEAFRAARNPFPPSGKSFRDEL